MGRLFWTFLLAFWATLLLAGAGVGTAVWLHVQSLREGVPASLAAGPRSAFMLDHASATLRHGGVAALRDALRDNARLGAPSLLAIDETGRDLLERPVPAASLADARRIARGEAGGPPTTAGALTTGAREIVAPDGRTWLLFAPAGAAGGPRGPPLPSPAIPIVIAIAAGLAFSGLLARYVSRPIRHLRRAFEAAAQGHLDTRVAGRMGRRRDELADLGRGFDRMAERLEQGAAMQRRLLHDVSHELRSPLARMQAAIGLMRQNPARTEAMVERIERESERLDALVGEVLHLSRLEARNAADPLEPVDLTELVTGIVADADFEARSVQRAVKLQAGAAVTLRCDPGALHAAIENVIRNAVRHGGPGSTVDVRLEGLAQGGARILVEDRGPGVAEDELEAIFEPFHRGRDARPGEGFGLGLTIARRAVEGQHGSIRAAARDGGGLSVEIRLPA